MSEIDLLKKFPAMSPIKAPPALFRVNGCGVGMYGKRDADGETGAYVSTWCVCILFIPVLCLRAYRVARAEQGGWYFLGREPLSALARGWNITLLAAIVASVGMIRYDAYTSSPAYLAKRQMESAAASVAQGHLGDAAKTYQALIVNGTPEAGNAKTAVGLLVDEHCARAPLSECVEVFAAAAQLARRGQAMAGATLAEKAVKIVEATGDKDPRSALAILDAVRPFVIDTRPLDERRFALLQRLVAIEPSNLDAITPLAALLERRGRLDEAAKLLLPVKDKLGDGEGARVLGVILARQGDLDAAYALLWPHVKKRLASLQEAERASERALQQLWDREIALLKQDKAPDDFYEKYRTATQDQQQAMVSEWVNGRIKDDPLYTSTQEALEREAAVVPVALELGMVMLQRAEAQAKPDERTAQLQLAETVFLAVGGIAGESDVYRLSVGEVYYWLGKQAEGRKLFDEYLGSKNRASQAILEVASRLRGLGSETEARGLAEEAYGKAANSGEKHSAAILRALCFKDLDDRINWLNKCNTAEPSIKATLAKASGDKAFEDGRDAEAVAQFQTAIDAYNSMPRTASTVNETALCQYGIFFASGDQKALNRCTEAFQQAVDLRPTDPILLYNAGSTLLSAAVADLIGQAIDLRMLREAGSVRLLGHLYKDRPSRQALVARVKEHPGVVRAMSYLDRANTLAPKNWDVYTAIYSVRRFTRDDVALRAMERRLKSADLDPADQLAELKEFLSGAKDQQRRGMIAASLKRGEARLSEARAKGGATAAVAIDHQVQRTLALDACGGQVDADHAVKLAEEAWRTSPSTASSSMLMAARLFRASADLRRSEPAFDAFHKKYARSLGVTYLMTLAAGEQSAYQSKVVAHPDVQAALSLLKEQARAFPDDRQPYEWAIFRQADAGESRAASDTIRKNPQIALRQSISSMLSPVSTAEAMESYWLSQITGAPDEGKEAIRKLAAQGVPTPVEP